MACWHNILEAPAGPEEQRSRLPDVRTQNHLASNPRCKFFANSTTASPGPVVVNNEIRARANLDGRPRELGCDRVVVAVLLP